ncbi:MAG: rod-binding protein [Treponema sp.]|jgi:flagellar protein FlgJ|nr:rod-binding protein [Treponema sp.]
MDTTRLGIHYREYALAASRNVPEQARRPGAPDFAEELAKAAAGQEAPPPAPPGKPVINKHDTLYEQCEALETFLVKTLITSMRDTVQKSGLLDTGLAGKIYEDMLYDEYAKDFTRNANFGLAELAYLELTGQRGRISPPALRD